MESEHWPFDATSRDSCEGACVSMRPGLGRDERRRRVHPFSLGGGADASSGLRRRFGRSRPRNISTMSRTRRLIDLDDPPCRVRIWIHERLAQRVQLLSGKWSGNPCRQPLPAGERGDGGASCVGLPETTLDLSSRSVLEGVLHSHAVLVSSPGSRPGSASQDTNRSNEVEESGGSCSVLIAKMKDDHTFILADQNRAGSAGLFHSSFEPIVSCAADPGREPALDTSTLRMPDAFARTLQELLVEVVSGKRTHDAPPSPVRFQEVASIDNRLSAPLKFSRSLDAAGAACDTGPNTSRWVVQVDQPPGPRDRRDVPGPAPTRTVGEAAGHEEALHRLRGVGWSDPSLIATEPALRRTHLRGHENILKRVLVHSGAFNLGLLMRQIVGVGRRGACRAGSMTFWHSSFTSGTADGHHNGSYQPRTALAQCPPLSSVALHRRLGRALTTDC